MNDQRVCAKYRRVYTRGDIEIRGGIARAGRSIYPSSLICGALFYEVGAKVKRHKP